MKKLKNSARLGAALVLVTTMTMTGCSRSNTPDGDASGNPSGSTVTVTSTPPVSVIGPRGGLVEDTNDDANAVVVAQSVVATMLRYDALYDSSPRDAASRAKKWMTDAGYDKVIQSLPSKWKTGEQERMASNKGYAESTTSLDPMVVPPVKDKIRQKNVSVIAQSSWEAADGSKGEFPVATYAVSLERKDAHSPWKASFAGIASDTSSQEVD